MQVAIAYDDPAIAGTASEGRLPEDFGAEYESKPTIVAIGAAIEACGHVALTLPLSDEFFSQVRRIRPALVFNVVEGVRGRGRESIVPAWLDHLRIPHSGSDALTLAVTLDKAMTKKLVAAAGLTTPPFVLARTIEQLNEWSTFPAFVKPNAEGSSMGVRAASRVETRDQLHEQVAWVLSEYGDCLVETFIPGREFGVGILGNGAPQVLPIAEVRGAGSVNTLDDKRQHRREHICPADVSEDDARAMRAMALTAYETLGCRDLARVDFRLDGDGRPMFLEINPLPGMCPHHSVFPKQAQAAGLSYEQLIGAIIDGALLDPRHDPM